MGYGRKPTVIGIVGVGKEPLNLIEPKGTIVSIIILADHSYPTDVFDEFASEAVRIAKEKDAIISFVDIPDKHRIPIASFINVGYREVMHSILMTCKLDGDYSQKLSLRFERVERKDTTNFLKRLREFSIGSQDVIVERVFSNLAKYREPVINYWFSRQLLFYVYNDENKLVGVVDMNPSRERNLVNIGISPPHRRKGYGRQLMLFMMNILKEWGKEDARLRVHAGNKIARRLYESLGFEQVDSKRALVWRKE